MNITITVLNDEIGAMTLAFEKAGFQVACAYITDNRSAELCRHNIRQGIVCDDLFELNVEEMPDVDGIVGRIWPKPLWNAGRKKEREYEVLQKYEEIFQKKHPQFFLFETFFGGIHSKEIEYFLKHMSEQGYRIIYKCHKTQEITGMPVTEKKYYILGLSERIGTDYQLGVEPYQYRYTVEDICQPASEIEEWYWRVKDEWIRYEEYAEEIYAKKNGFLCWKQDRYVDTEEITWNSVRMPLVRIDGRIRKITHREVARIKGFPDSFYLDITNKDWMYKKLIFSPDVTVVYQIARHIQELIVNDTLNSFAALEWETRKQRAIDSRRFEELLERYVCDQGLEVQHERKKDGGAPDLIVEINGKIVFIEAKLYTSNIGVDSKVLQTCKRLLAYKKMAESNLVLAAGNIVSNNMKHICREQYGVHIWDVANLLWMFQTYEEIKNEFVSLLNYTIADIIPVKPEFAFFQTVYEKTKPISLPDKLRSIAPGKKQSTAYEDICIEILKYVLGDSLTLWKKQKKASDGLYRFDLCCKIKYGELQEFFDTIRRHFNTKYIVFEFKNYRDPITQKEIYTTEKYLYKKALRSVAIIISRKGADKNALSAAFGCLREDGKLILCLSDEDLVHMIEIKEQGEQSAADYLSDMLDEMLINLGK